MKFSQIYDDDVEKEVRAQMESIEKLPKSELNKVVCYPSYSKFDITDEINPKSVPMFPQNKNIKKGEI